MVLKILSLVIVLIIAPSDSSTSCFLDGQKYTLQPNPKVPNLYVQSAEECQGNCKAQPLTCHYFSYATMADAANSIFTPGACWLVDGTATLAEGSGFVSGPAECPENPGANNVTVIAGAATSAPQASTTQGRIEESGAITTTEIAAIVPIVGTEAPANAEDDSSGGGGFPWWGYLLAFLALVGIGCLTYIFACRGTKAPKKRKPAAKKNNRGAKMETLAPAVAPSTKDSSTLAETEPLIAPQAAYEALPTMPGAQYTQAMITPAAAVNSMGQMAQGGTMAMGQMMPGQMMMPMPTVSMPMGPRMPMSMASPYAQPQPVQSYQYMQPGAMQVEPMGSYMTAMPTQSQPFMYR